MSGVMQKQIIFFGRPQVLACDGRCDKAWGMNDRPKHHFADPEDAPDDCVYIADDELGTAPPPSDRSEEGGHIKPSAEPLRDPERMNRWCARQCERSVMVEPGVEVQLRDMNDPRPNCAHRSIQEARDAAATRRARR